MKQLFPKNEGPENTRENRKSVIDLSTHEISKASTVTI